MHQTETTTEPTPQEQQSLPPGIAFVLRVVRTLLGYGRQLDQALPQQADHPRFPTLAAGFGTHDIKRILAHIQRGILRAIMLERYLLARAAADHDIEPVHPPEPADPADIATLELKLRAPAQPSTKPSKKPNPDDPMHFAMPTLKQLESQIRRRSVGRTLADICTDLGIAATVSDGAFWHEIYLALTHFGANLEEFYNTQNHRQETFQDERDQRPETWDQDWRDHPRDAIRHILGSLLGDPPPESALAAE